MEKLKGCKVALLGTLLVMVRVGGAGQGPRLRVGRLPIALAQHPGEEVTSFQCDKRSGWRGSRWE